MSLLYYFRAIDLWQTFPLALRPVNQIVTPFCLSRSVRSDDSTEPGWKVMLVAMEKGCYGFGRPLRGHYGSP